MVFPFLVQKTIVLLDCIAHTLKPCSVTAPSPFRFCLRPVVLRIRAGIFNHPYHPKGPVLQPDPDPAFSFHFPACFNRVIQQIGQDAASVPVRNKGIRQVIRYYFETDACVFRLVCLTSQYGVHDHVARVEALPDITVIFL